MKAEIEKSRVLEAASKCPTAKETLKVLFPEFFEEDKEVGFAFVAIQTLDGFRLIEKRTVCEYAGKSFWLNSESFNWNLEKDKSGELCLIPTKK